MTSLAGMRFDNHFARLGSRFSTPLPPTPLPEPYLVSANPDAAALMGVNKDRVIALTFLLGGLMAGVAAVLYDLNFGVTKFSAGFLIGLKAFTAAVLGGIGNLRGALLGGLLLGLAENWGQALLGSAWRDVIAFVFLIVVLMFRPTGILGESLGRARV